MRVMKRCIVCGNEFIADRRTAKYCSKKCHTRSKSIKAHEDAIEHRISKQKEKSTQPETIEPCKHPDCYYHSAKNTLPTCDYILRTGVPRGCKVSECDKYKPRGKEKNKTIVIFDRLQRLLENNSQPEIAEFKVHSDQLQKSFISCRDCIDKIADTEKAAKMRMAIKTIMQQLIDSLEVE